MQGFGDLGFRASREGRSGRTPLRGFGDLEGCAQTMRGTRNLEDCAQTMQGFGDLEGCAQTMRGTRNLGFRASRERALWKNAPT